MEKSVQGVQPQRLSDEELVRHAYLMAYKLPAEWVKEMARRIERLIDEKNGPQYSSRGK